MRINTYNDYGKDGVGFPCNPVEQRLITTVEDDRGNPIVGIYYDPDLGEFTLGYWDMVPVESEWHGVLKVRVGPIVTYDKEG